MGVRGSIVADIPLRGQSLQVTAKKNNMGMQQAGLQTLGKVSKFHGQNIGQPFLEMRGSVVKSQARTQRAIKPMV